MRRSLAPALASPRIVARFKGASFISRGEVIITQKEAKGEYGKEGNWYWNRDTAYGMPAEYGNQEIQPHALDNTNINGVPARMSNTGTTYGSNNYCTGEVETSDGDLLMSGSQIINQKSCTPNTNNVGNYYGWVAAVAGDNVSGGRTSDSICPSRWMLPNGDTSDVDKSYASITLAYAGIGSSTSGLATSVEQSLRESAASFIRGGNYSYSFSSRYVRGTYGCYWSSRANSSTRAYLLYFGSTVIYPRYTDSKGNGLAVRCVAR